MADINNHAYTGSVPDNCSRPVWFKVAITAASTMADNGESVLVFNLPAGHIFVVDGFGHSATLGASCTAQLRVGTTAITAATTAGGASSVGANGAAHAMSSSSQEVNILIGGADTSGAATIHVQGWLVRPFEVTAP